MFNKKNKKSRTKKIDTCFDEYEKRGDVLEGYEDLNSSKSSDDNDELINQIYQDHSDSGR